MPKRGFYYCTGCITLQSQIDVPSVDQCRECAVEFKKLRKLQTKIVWERPHLGNLRPSDLFTKMYEALKALEGKTK